MQVVLGSTIAAICLACLSAIFSGLTLGLMTLDVVHLRILMDCADSTGSGKPCLDAEYARRIYGIRKDGNLLLVTLLICNVGVNAGFSILLGTWTSGMVGFLISTGVLTIFGEIVPQAVFSRYALPVCHSFVPFVHVCEFLMTPVAWPLAAALDLVLGVDLGKLYTREELANLIRHHALEGRVLVKEEGKILGGGLTFGSKRAYSIMKGIDQTVGMLYTEKFSPECIERIVRSGYSRVAVFGSCSDDPESNPNTRIQGFVHVKDLLGIKDLDKVTAHDLLLRLGRPVLCLESRTLLMTLLNTFKLGKSHIAILYDGTTPEWKHVGIITLEDVLEEILQDEILDEFDEYRSLHLHIRSSA